MRSAFEAESLTPRGAAPRSGSVAGGGKGGASVWRALTRKVRAGHSLFLPDGLTPYNI